MIRAAMLAFAAATFAPQFAIAAESYVRPPYGCFRVNVSELNIRERPYAASPSIAVAHGGQILIKSKRFCNWRGYFCAVEFDQGGNYVQGYADKNFLVVDACPASLAYKKK